jgi:LuxR family maltose regulon positive regulatory protein
LKPTLEPSREQNPLYDELTALEAVLMAMRGDTRSALACGLAQWQRISQGHRFAAGALANVISYCLVLEGDFERARAFCDEARLCNEEIGSALGLGYALGVSGMIEVVQGNLDQALEQFDEIDKMAKMHLRQPWFETTHVKVASMGLIASVLYEKDRLEEANDLLQRYLPLVMHQPSFDMLLLSHVIYARIKVAQGDFHGALDVLERADRNPAAGWQLARAHRIIGWERVRIDLIQARADRASARAELLLRTQSNDVEESDCWFVEELCGRGIGSIRFDIACARYEPAQARLEVEIAKAQAGGRRWRLLKLLVLRVLAFDAQGHRDAAHAVMTQALELGFRIGARRSFAEEGKRIETVMADLPPHFLGRLPDADAIVRYWLDLRGERPPRDSASTALGATTLSERERAILKLLATGMGNEQIATAIFLSVNTVKWYIRRILEKLEARNRSEAVFIARRLGLIDA